MALRKDVLELLRLYEGENSREAYKPSPLYEADGVTFRLPRDRRDNKWITEDPVSGRWLVFRRQVPDRLEPAYEIALGEGLLEQHLLKPEQQDAVYRSHGQPGVPQDQPWPVVPAWRDALVMITDKGRAALAQDRTGEVEAVWLGNGVVRIGDKPMSLEFQEATVLEAIVELGGAAMRPDLERKTKVKDVAEIMKRLKERFPDHIILPGGRGKGGYATTIKDGTKAKG